MTAQHHWNEEYCSCGQDSVTCQGCGRRVCGAVAVWRGGAGDGHGNVGPCCFARFGFGHAGGSRGLLLRRDQADAAAAQRRP